MAWNNDTTPYTVDAAEVVAMRARDTRVRAFTFVREPLSRFLSGCVWYTRLLFELHVGALD